MKLAAILISITLVTIGAAPAAPEPETRAPGAAGAVEQPAPANGDKARPGAASPPDAAGASPAVTTLLMFYGRAEEAMKLYTSVIPNSGIRSIRRYGKDEAGAEGSVMHAMFTLNGREFMCIDSIAVHDFTFTPATSLFVTCSSEAEIDGYFSALSRDGKVFMPLQEYPFAKKFAWFTDKFGVSWQLSWPRG